MNSEPYVKPQTCDNAFSQCVTRIIDTVNCSKTMQDKVKRASIVCEEYSTLLSSLTANYETYTLTLKACG